MVVMPEQAVVGLGVHERAAAAAWWSGLDEAEATALAAQWSESWPDGGWLVPLDPVVVDQERAVEAEMWRRDLQEYVLAHPERALLLRPRLRMISPPPWRRYRRYDAAGELRVPSMVQPLSWRRSTGQRFL